MIELYWNEVFGKYKEDNGKFNIPGFPEPMMSKHFGVKNIIGPTTHQVKQTFKLCTFDPLKVSLTERKSRCEPLNAAIMSEQFWEFQNNNVFIRRLLPFLNTLPQSHYHFFCKDNDKIIASALVGEAECGCFLFNFSVSEDARNRGMARKLLLEIRDSFQEKRIFYWTVHPWFTFDSNVQEYHLHI